MTELTGMTWMNNMTEMTGWSECPADRNDWNDRNKWYGRNDRNYWYDRNEDYEDHRNDLNYGVLAVKSPVFKSPVFATEYGTST